MVDGFVKPKFSDVYFYAHTALAAGRCATPKWGLSFSRQYRRVTAPDTRGDKRLAQSEQ